MNYRMLRKDLQRNKAVAATLFVFILMAAMLLTSAVAVITQLLASMDDFFLKARAPHFVQMHAGELDQAEIDRFAAESPLVEAQYTQEMLNVGGESVYLGSDGENEGKSVIEISFVKQNPSFDLLLGLDNEPVVVEPGQVAAPVYYLKEKGLQIGDSVLIRQGDFAMDLVVTDFARDAQMNSSLVTSKRFVLHEQDWASLKASGLFPSEYLIEFMLADIAQTAEFEQMYQASGLPQQDTAITYGLYKLINALSDGLTAAVVILISMLLMTISLLCLRYAMVAAVEEDYREIGAMKALGIPLKTIRRVYMVKYIALAAVACILGCFLATPLAKVFTANITLHMGEAERTAGSWLGQAVAAAFVFLLVVLFVRLVLGRFRRISAVEALRGMTGGRRKSRARKMPLHRTRNPFLNVFLGVRDVVIKASSYGVLALVFALCVLLASVPAAILSTIGSPTFISYMGAGMSDLRIDLQRSENMEARFAGMMEKLRADSGVKQVAGFTTRAYTALLDQGQTVTMKVESGDFAVFPLEYSIGRAPSGRREIALSAMNAEELEKTVGDTVTLLVEGESVEMAVCGIYQDVTNGGKTAKSLLEDESQPALWYVVNINLEEGVDAGVKKLEFQEAFAPAKVLDMEDYLSQTMGSILSQLRLAAICGAAASTLLCLLVSAMFLKMALAKEAGDIAILRSLGFSHHHLKGQYITRMILVLAVGVAAGTFASASLGTAMAGGLLSMLGASSVELVVNPLVNYVLLPAALAATVTVVVFLTSGSLKKTDSLRLNLE